MVSERNPDSRILKDGSPPLLAFPKGLFSTLPLLKIGICSVPIRDFPRSVAQRTTAKEKPAKFAVEAAEAALHFVRLYRIQSFPEPPTGKLWRSFMRTADCPPVIFLSSRSHLTFHNRHYWMKRQKRSLSLIRRRQQAVRTGRHRMIRSHDRSPKRTPLCRLDRCLLRQAFRPGRQQDLFSYWCQSRKIPATSIINILSVRG